MPLHVAGIVGAAAGQRDAVIDDIARTPAAAPARGWAGLLALEGVFRGDAAFLFGVPGGAWRVVSARGGSRMVGTRRGRRTVAGVSSAVAAAREAWRGAEEQQREQQRSHGAESVRCGCELRKGLAADQRG